MLLTTLPKLANIENAPIYNTLAFSLQRTILNESVFIPFNWHKIQIGGTYYFFCNSVGGDESQVSQQFLYNILDHGNANLDEGDCKGKIVQIEGISFVVFTEDSLMANCEEHPLTQKEIAGNLSRKRRFADDSSNDTSKLLLENQLLRETIEAQRQIILQLTEENRSLTAENQSLLSELFNQLSVKNTPPKAHGASPHVFLAPTTIPPKSIIPKPAPTNNIPESSSNNNPTKAA